VAIKGILFDKDGTLLDFHATWMPAYRSAAEIVSRDAGQPELADRLLAMGGYDHRSGRCKPGLALASGTNADIARLWAEECGLGDAMQLVTRMEEIFAREAAARAVPVGDLASLFARLTERGLHLGIATMDSEALAHATMSSAVMTAASVKSPARGWSPRSAIGSASSPPKSWWWVTRSTIYTWDAPPAPGLWSVS
jgi:phosphoglycolate phosphatase